MPRGFEASGLRHIRKDAKYLHSTKDLLFFVVGTLLLWFG